MNIKITNKKKIKEKYSKKRKYLKKIYSKKRKYVSFKSRKNKKNKKNQKNQKGGNFNDSFLVNYEENLRKIQEAIAMYSEKHSIDEEMSNRFIDEQLTSIRQQAARDLIENTIYITLSEVSSIIEKLIIKMYTEYNLNESENIYLYTSKPNKSFYFISVLALYYIRKNGFKEPTKYISSLSPSVLDETGSNPILMIDDISYSGSQLSNLLKSLYENYVIKQKKEPPNIIVSLVGLNDVSKKKIEYVYINRKTIQLPFKIVYLQERLYQPLLLKLGIERYFILNLFFSQTTRDKPVVSIYLDHKIADEISTYKKSLLYGPIVPRNYNYDIFSSNFIESLDYDGINLYLSEYISQSEYSTDQLIILINKFNEENGTSDRFNIKQSTRPEFERLFLKMLTYIVDKVKEIEESELNINDVESREIEFRPFINTCKDDEILLKNISDPEIKNMNYLFFNTSPDCMINQIKCPADADNFQRILMALDLYPINEADIKYMIDNIPQEPIMTTEFIQEIRCSKKLYKKNENGKYLISDEEIYRNELEKYKKNIKIRENEILKYDRNIILRTEIENIIDKLSNVDCPFTWYKKGELKMI